VRLVGHADLENDDRADPDPAGQLRYHERGVVA
jgi:hypothetical protein